MPAPAVSISITSCVIPPQENIDNPLYMDEVQVVDEPGRAADKPAAAAMVGFTSSPLSSNLKPQVFLFYVIKAPA